MASRGIGIGDDASGAPWSIQVADLPFQGSANVTDLEPREVAYYRVEVPAGVSSWHVDLQAAVGDTLLAVRKGALPNSEAGFKNAESAHASYVGGARRDKAGSEYFYRLPAPGEFALAGGTFYLAVASVGTDPHSTSYLGENPSTAVLTSHGEMPTSGDVTTIVDEGAPLVWPSQALAYGQEQAYRFRIPPHLVGAEIRLEGATGGPVAAGQIFDYYKTSYPYGAGGSGYDPDELGWYYEESGDSAIQLRGTGDATIVVRGGSNVQDAQFDLVVEALAPQEMAFDGGVATGDLAKSAIHLYRVEVPELVDGAPLAGWELSIDYDLGDAKVRVRPDGIPGGSTGGWTFGPSNDDTVVLSPPYLAPGVWYVEVEGSQLTEYELSSRPVRPLRTWTMPASGEVAQVPGVPHPAFGDSGVDDAGNDIVNPTSGDLGTGLGQQKWHFYRIDVPADNGGLLRTRLEALSGEPNLYVRHGGAPTMQHKASGQGGSLYDWYDTQSGTTYGLWVPKNTRYGRYLTPGTYWIGVTAPQSNVRYRLSVDVGTIEELTQDGGQVIDHSLAAGDMRFYRVQTQPSALDEAQSAPLEWMLAFSQSQGDVGVLLREHVPPGFPNYLPTSESDGQFASWTDDNSYLASPDPRAMLAVDGTHVLTMPPVMPGVEYYVGVYAKTDATYSLQSSVSTTKLHLDAVLAYTNDALSTTIPAGQSQLYRIDVPSDARRWIHDATHATGVKLYLHRGTIPPETTYADWHHTGSNGDTNHTFYSSTYEWNYPWAPDASYFMLVRNTTAVDQPFDLVLDGRSVDTDDADGDTLPDWWEWKYLGNPVSYQPGQDNDQDGLTNQQEFELGTHPKVKDTDGDGLEDGLEIERGTDPTAVDSDNDGVIDGEDTDPTDPTLTGLVVHLSLGEVDSGSYGAGYGASAHPNAVEIVFDRINSVPHWVHARGWDIDAAGEVDVYLNGTWVGELPASADEQLGRAAIWWFEPSQLNSGQNRVRFVHESVGGGASDTWGVAQLALYALDTPLGYDAAHAFDALHADGFLLHALAQADRLWVFKTYDLEGSDVEISLNGLPYSELPASGDGAFSAPVWLIVDDADYGPDWNVFDFHPKAGADAEWTIWLTKTTGFSTSIDYNEDQRITWLAPRTAEDRQMGFNFASLSPVEELTWTGTAATASGIPLVYPYGFRGPVYWFSSAGAADALVFDHHLVEGGGGAYWDVDLVYYGTPKNSDDDEWPDATDVFPHYDYAHADSDGDGVGDAWEVNFFGDLVTIDGTIDTDDDGKIDLEEFADGDDPTCGVGPCTGDECSDPVVVTSLPYAHMDLLYDKTDSQKGPGGTCGTYGTNSRDMVYMVTAPMSGTLRVMAASTMNYLTLRVASDCPTVDPDACVAAAPLHCCGPSWEAEWTTQAGEVWYITVDNRVSNYNAYYSIEIDYVPCIAQCEGKVCGSDGCGGECGPCDDGDPCNGVEQCADGTMCVLGQAPDCDDGDPCTTDSCGATGCEHVDSGVCCTTDADCDDGDECTVHICDNQLCTATPVMNCCVGGNCPAEGCDEHYSDINLDAKTDISDVQCMILVNLWTIAPELQPQPPCLAADPDAADLTCDGLVTVADVLVTIQRALGIIMSTDVDADGNNCPDACEL